MNMGSDQAKKLGADGRMDGLRFFPENLYSPRSNPKHPDHEDWKNRTDPLDPEMVNLLAAMREHGTDEGQPVLVYHDGNRTCVSDGDRRQAACKIINDERKKKREKPHRLRALVASDPVLARALGNACRKGDKPMVLARRLRSNMGAMATDPDKPETGLPACAAACGVSLRDARLLIRCLALPPEIQARVGAADDGIPFDVAASMARAGSEKAAEAVSLVALDGKGKATKARIKAAVRKVKGPPKPRTCPAPMVRAIGGEFRRVNTGKPEFTADDFAAFADWIAGDITALNDDKYVRVWTIVESAETARKGARA